MPPKLAPQPVPIQDQLIPPDDLYQCLAVRTANRLANPPSRRIPVIDLVLAAYPPLAEEGFTAIAGVTCVESALLLCLNTLWWKTEEGTHIPDVRKQLYELKEACPIPLNMLGMRRKMQRNGLMDFPLYSWDTPNATYILEFGTPREDMLSVVFVPADIPQGLLAGHYTFGVVIPPEPPAAPPVFIGQWPTIVFTSYPLSLDTLTQAGVNVLWRARPTPENAHFVSVETRAGNVCTCLWQVVCEHELAFRAANVGYTSITLEGKELVAVRSTSMSFP